MTFLDPANPTMSEIITQGITPTVTKVVEIVGQVAQTIIAEPLLLIPVGFALLGMGVSIVKKFAN